MIQAGDSITCIRKEFTADALTIGREYKVLTSVYGNWFQIINDAGESHVYEESYFSQIPQNSEIPPGCTSKAVSDKPHLAYFDAHLEYEMGIGMRHGANKHGWNNHRELTAEAAQQILDSVKRHLNAYLRGEQIDSELQINHLACVVNNINFLYRLDRLFGHEAVLESIYGETQ